MTERRNYSPRNKLSDKLNLEDLVEVKADNLKDAITSITDDVLIQKMQDLVVEGPIFTSDNAKNIEQIKNIMTKNEITKEKPPVYDLSRDNQSGKVNLQPRKHAIGEQIITIDVTKREIAEKMIVDLEREILKLEIDIEIHEKINQNFSIENRVDTVSRKEINNRRLTSLMENLVYNTDKRDILIKMIESWGSKWNSV